MTSNRSSITDAVLAVEAAGREAWAGIEVDHAALRAFLSRRLQGPDPMAEVQGLCAADLYLACACVAGVPGAAERFDEGYRPVIRAAVARLDGGRGILDEVLQRVRDIALVGAGRGRPALAGYGGRGDLRGWVRVVAVREAYKLLRADRGRVGVEDDEMFDVLASPGEDPELAILKQRYRNEFRTAFRGAVAALPRRERTALRLHVLDGLSIDEIAPMYSVHRATAARWLARARERLLVETRRELRRALGIDDEQVDSVIRLIQSRLDVTLDTVLQSQDDD